MDAAELVNMAKRATEIKNISYVDGEQQPEEAPLKKKKKKLTKAQKRELRLQRELEFKKLEITVC